MPGTRFGLTNETIWMCLSPVSASASMSSILRAVGIGPFSIWKPSRGPSSLMVIERGRLDMMTSSCAGLHLFERNVRVLQQFAPFRHFVPNEGASFFRRGGHHFAAFGRELFLCVGDLENRDELLVQT